MRVPLEKMVTLSESREDWRVGGRIGGGGLPVFAASEVCFGRGRTRSQGMRLLWGWDNNGDREKEGGGVIQTCVMGRFRRSTV